MANAFTKAQFMEPPGSGTGAVPIGAVKAGDGITISADGTIALNGGSGIINNIIVSNGIQGGGSSPNVYLSLVPPTDTTLGGVRTIAGSGCSIDSNGVLRVTTNYTLINGPGILLTNVTPEGSTVSAAIAGTNTAGRGSIYVDPAAFPGLKVSADGGLSLTPPTSTGIGGVKAGTGVTIDPLTGVLNATGTGGTITAVGAGTGLGGGGTTGAVSLFLKPPSGTTIGGVYQGDNVVIEPDGKISIANMAGVQTVTKAPGSAIDLTGTATNPIIGVFLAGTLSTGVCRLYDGIDGNPPILPSSTAATPTAVKTVADIANTKLPLAGGIMSGPITFTAGQVFPGTVNSSTFTQLGGILVGDTSPPGYAQLPVGADGQVLSANSASPLGVEWVSTGQGTVNNISVSAPLTVTNPSGPSVSLGINAASTSTSGTVVLYDGTDGGGSSDSAATPLAVATAYNLAAAALPLSGGTMSGLIVFDGSQVFPGVLPLAGGTMTGDITFAGTQTFPGVLTQGSLSAIGAVDIGGTPSNPIISVDTATTAQLGVVQPDGTTITIDGNGVISAAPGGSSLPLSGGTMTGNIVFAGTQAFPGTLPLAGGTMTGNITFNAGQTFPGTISSSLLDVTGDMVYASAANTPASLPIGAAGTILAVNGGVPAWRTSAQLGLLTSAAAASTYAPVDSPTFTGPVIVNGGGSAGANAMTVSGGNLVLATAFTPASSSAPGSVGELAWDNSGYLYFCYLPNTWGRVQIDLTPF